MYLEIGPASLVVIGEKDGRPYDFDRVRVENMIRVIMEEIRNCLPILKQKANRIKKSRFLPDVAKKMVMAAQLIDGATLTPMSAVAGAVADSVIDHFRNEGLDFMSVNNGGDISILNSSRRLVRVGIGDIKQNKPISRVLSVEGLNEFGMATSGFGGRSFTLGLADSVTVVAENGATADAAATHICNCTSVATDRVVRRKASEIDPLTDIGDEYVTVSIGQLNDKLIATALDNGLTIAANMKKQQMIYDAVIDLRGSMVTTVDGDKPITLEVSNGD